MQTVLIVIHLMVVVALIAVVLLAVLLVALFFLFEWAGDLLDSGGVVGPGR